MVVTHGTTQIHISTHPTTPARTHVVSTSPFSFPVNGMWSVFALVTQGNGRVTRHEMTYSGDKVQLHIGVVGTVAVPTCDPPGGAVTDEDIVLVFGVPTIPITLACATAGADIYWTIAAISDPQPAVGGFINFATVPIDGLTLMYGAGLITDVALYLQGRKAGSTSSDVVKYEFWRVP
jgi:hypothetical protein